MLIYSMGIAFSLQKAGVFFNGGELENILKGVTVKNKPTIPPIREASIFRPKMPNIMPLLNLKKIILSVSH